MQWRSNLARALMRDTPAYRTEPVDYAAMWDRHAGGLIPLLSAGREVHVVDGATYTLSVTWCRRGFEFSYHTPRTPRKVRRLRERELARVQEFARRKLAGEQQYRAGDILPKHQTWIPGEVLSFVDCEGDEWHRAFGDLRYALADDTGRLDRSQEYDWVHMFEGEPCGWSTDDGRLDYLPIRITRVVERAYDAP